MAKKILVADDDAGILDAMKIMLEFAGFAVETSVNGEILYHMKKNYPDLFLLDVWMSGKDGRVICKFLKQNPLTQHIPVILVSASPDIKKSAEDAGADDFLEKPFEVQELLDKVKKFTGESD